MSGMQPTLRWLERGTGEPVVLLHGLLGDLYHRDDTLDALHASCRALAPSLPIVDEAMADVGRGRRARGWPWSLIPKGALWNLHAHVIGRQQSAPTVSLEMSVASSSPVITLDRVTKAFGTHRALDEVSATIHPGQLVAIVGRSGAGKTTLLRCLTRATTADGGVIRFGATNLATLHGRALRAHRARVGMIYQQFNLVRRLRVLDNVLVGRLPHLHGWRRMAALARWFSATDRETAVRCLHHVGLVSRVWQRADTLSGGEQQRVAIAKILAQNPVVILADEPVASLDVANGRLVMSTLREVASRAGLTVVATLHHVEYARHYADRVLGLRAGRLVFNGAPAELTDEGLLEIFGEPVGPLVDGDAAATPAVVGP